MATNPDAFRWLGWRVRGDEQALARTLDNIDAALPTGWSLESGGDSAPPRVVRQYRLRPEGSSGSLLVPIYRWDGTELQAGGGLAENLSPMRPRAVVSEFLRFLDEVIVPAATKAGATIHILAPEELYFGELPSDAREALRAFDAKARKALPLEWDESEAWQDFVIAACRSSAKYNRNLLTAWFVSRGWTGSAAEELTTQFFDQLQLLDRYRETLVIA